MEKYTKLLTSILSGSSDKNIAFESLCRLLIRLGFEQRIKGDHFFFRVRVLMKLSIYNPWEKCQSPIKLNKSAKSF